MDFSERLKDNTLRIYDFVNLRKVKKRVQML